MIRPRLLPTWLLLAGAGALALAGVAAREYGEQARLRRELAAVREEISVRRGRAQRHREQVVVRAPFATWAHLVAGLHEAAAASRLDRFRYATLGVVPVTDPTAPLPAKEGGQDRNPSPGEAPGPGAARATAAPSPAPYRAMRARVEGSGTYGQVVSFVRALAAVDPPLQLDRIVVRAGPGGPSFEAFVHLVTALPVESPRVVALDRTSRPAVPGNLDEALAGLVAGDTGPETAEVTR